MVFFCGHSHWQATWNDGIFHHSLRGAGATLWAGGQLQSEAELSSQTPNTIQKNIEFEVVIVVI